jgi:hypothetical protein
MSAHGGSNSWNLSPSALTPPVWEVGLADNAQDRPRLDDANLEQAAQEARAEAEREAERTRSAR